MDYFGEEIPESLLERAIMLQDMVTVVATGGGMQDNIYRILRKEFIEDTNTKSVLPSFIRTCRTTDTLWAHFKRVHSGSGAYSIRTDYINEAFSSLLDYIENTNVAPSDAEVSLVISKYNAEGVQTAWTKALERRSSDPQGAITSARTLLEEICKHILEDADVKYESKWDLPKLYRETSTLLNIAPSQHTEEVFKKILGGCQSIVENLGGLRNKISDAHALGRKQVKPAPRHAALAVNLSGSMALFLIETWLEKSTTTKES